MKNDLSKNERKIRPYKTTCRKCETEQDAEDMVRLAVENSSKGQMMKVIGNQIDNPDDITANPDRITEQILKQQKEVLGLEKCRSRRINSMTYLIDKKQYNTTVGEVTEFAKELLATYSKYPAIAMISENKRQIRLDHISGNLCEDGPRMTQVFNPATLYNIYKESRNKSL